VLLMRKRPFYGRLCVQQHGKTSYCTMALLKDIHDDIS
jgi:hypothetical protein